ncbi:MAG TPA: sugar ABC transporter permease [Gammaproteobacteria bacterium]|nr:sugar ABC transporter permease [Gammaproteobacteria bacterium]
MAVRRLPHDTRVGWLLCAPAVAAMLLVTAYPIAYAVWLSLFRYDLRFPEQRAFVGLANYASVLGSEVWWRALANTALITVASVAVELVLGFAFALLMHRIIFGRRLVRTALLVPYGIVTVVAALAWRLAFDPTTGFVNRLLDLGGDWLASRGPAFFVIVFAEVWKTTPFMALLLLAGLTLVPRELLNAARVDGATRLQAFSSVTLPLMRPAVLVALLFRTLDAFRIFDSVFVLTGGAQNTASVSIVAYRTLITRLNLGLGSAVAVLVFVCVLIIAAVFVRLFGVTYGEAGARGNAGAPAR